MRDELKAIGIGSRIAIGFFAVIGCGAIIGGLVMFVYGTYVPAIVAMPFLFVGLSSKLTFRSSDLFSDHTIIRSSL